MLLSRRRVVLGCAASSSLLLIKPVEARVRHAARHVAAPRPARRFMSGVSGVSTSGLDPNGLIRKGLLEDALVALERHGGRITKRDRIYLVDFRRHSSQPRLCSLDLKSGRVTTYRTAHGSGSDPARTGYARRFSNTPESKASSLGAYVTAGQSAGARDGANVLLDGLDSTNSNARERAIIVHAAAYCEPSYLAGQGMLGRSNGCFALSHADLTVLRPAMDEGRLIYAGA
jgi:hypothetical protein